MLPAQVIEEAAQRAIAAGADPSLEYVGAGAEGIVFADDRAAYKVARHRGIDIEAEALEALSGSGLVPEFYGYDRKNRVIVRELVVGEPGRWSDSGRLFDLYQSEVRPALIRAGFLCGEFKEDSFIIQDDGTAVMVDLGFLCYTGERLARDLRRRMHDPKGIFDLQSDIRFAVSDGDVSPEEASVWADQLADLFGEDKVRDLRQTIKWAEESAMKRNPGRLIGGFEYSTYSNPKQNEWTVDAYVPGSWERVGRAEFVGVDEKIFEYDEEIDVRPRWVGSKLAALKGWDVRVHPDYRRRGIARTMYQVAEETWGVPVVSGDFQTDEGEAFVKARKNPRRSAGMYPSDFDPRALRRGAKVEMEHTDDPREAQRIAMDHLAEDPDYYEKLALVHTENRERGTGRYAPTKMKNVCTCGHTLGEHTAARVRFGGEMLQECLAPGCGCVCYTKAKRNPPDTEYSIEGLRRALHRSLDQLSDTYQELVQRHILEAEHAHSMGRDDEALEHVNEGWEALHDGL